MSRRETRTNLSPALIGSVSLHALVVAAILIGPWKASKPVIIGESVPVTIVTEGPTNVRPALEAPEDQTAQTEEPTPEADPQPPAPVPAPTPTPAPAPPKTAPTPTPTPKPPTPKPPTPKPAKPEPDFFASLEKTLAKTPKAAGKPVANAARGPTRPETATQARPGAGAMTGLQAAAINGMKDEIQRRWNPNCEVEGGSAVQVKVGFKLTTAGRIIGQVTAGDAEKSSDAVVRAAAERAIRAVYQSAPFEGLPPDYYGQQLNLNFKARDACAAR
jgi:outer membrane biosynthesis protein TonB